MRGKKRLLEKMLQGAGAFRRGCRGCRKTDALNREGRSLSCRRKKNAARQAKSVGKNGYLIICRKVSERFVAGVGLRESGCERSGEHRRFGAMPCRRKEMRCVRQRVWAVSFLTEKNGFAGGERFSVGIIPPHIFNYTQTRLLAKMKTMQTALLMSLTVVKPLGLRLLQNPRVFPGIFIADDLLLLISFPSCLISRKMS